MKSAGHEVSSLIESIKAKLGGNIRFMEVDNPLIFNIPLSGLTGARSLLIICSDGDAYNFVFMGGINSSLSTATINRVYGPDASVTATATISSDKKALTITFKKQIWGKTIVIWTY
jgi:hypothetical protein